MQYSQLKANTNALLTFYENKPSELHEFLGFTKVDERYSDKPAFDTLKEAKAYYSAKNVKQLEAAGDHLGYGHNVYAVFKDLESGSVWCAYLYLGTWVFGSSAEALTVNHAYEALRAVS